MKKSKRFKIKKHKRFDKQKYNNLTYYEDYEIKKIKNQRLQEYGVLSLLGLLGLMFLMAGNDNILSEVEMDLNNVMNKAGFGLTLGSLVGTIINILRNGDRKEELRRLKNRRKEILNVFESSNKRK